MREEYLLLLGVLRGHARRMLLRFPSLHTATLPVDERHRLSRSRSRSQHHHAAANNPA